MKKVGIDVYDTTGIRRIDANIYRLDKNNNLLSTYKYRNGKVVEFKVNDDDQILTCSSGKKRNFQIGKFMVEFPKINNIILSEGDGKMNCIDDIIPKGTPPSNFTWDTLDLHGIGKDIIDFPIRTVTTGTGNNSSSNTDTGNNTSGNSSSNAGTGNNSTGYQTGGIKPISDTNQKRKKMKFRIIDAETKEPLSGAEAQNKNTKQGNVTDIDGWLEIQAKEGDPIEIRHLGYVPLVMPAEDIPLVLEMKPTSENLDAVTITIQKKRSKWWLLAAAFVAYKVFFGGSKGMNEPEVPTVNLE